MRFTLVALVASAFRPGACTRSESLLVPGFADLTAFDDTHVILDAAGDTHRDTFLSMIRDGSFRPIGGS